MIKKTVNLVEIDPGKAKKRKRTSREKLEVFSSRKESQLAKSDIQDALLEVDRTLQSPIHEHLKMDTDATGNPAKESAKKKRNRRRKQTSRDILEVFDSRKDIAIANSGDIPVAFLEVDTTLRSPIHEHLKMDTDSTGNPAKDSVNAKKKKNMRRKQALREILGVFDNRKDIEKAKEVFDNRKDTEKAKGDIRDALLEADTTLQSPVHDHLKMDADLTGNPAKESAKKKRNRRRKQKSSGILEVFDNRKDIEKGKEVFDNRNDAEKVKIDMQDALLEVDTTLQSPVHEHAKMDTDSTGNPPKESKNKRRKRRRKQMSSGMLEVFDNRKDTEISKTDMQDALLEADTTLLSPIHEHSKMDTDSTANPGKEITQKKRNRRRRRRKNRKAADKDGMQNTNQTGIVTTLSLSEDHDGLEKNDKLNKVQSAAQECGFSAREESRPYHCKEDQPELVERVWEMKVKAFSHEGQHADSASICDPNLRQMAENEKFDNKLERAVEGSCDDGKETAAESQSERKHPSSDAEITKPRLFLVKDVKPSRSNPLCQQQLKKQVACLSRKLVILDLNGLLADIIFPAPKECKADIKMSRRAIFKRPFYYDFLKFCFERFDVGIWSSRSKKIFDQVVDYLLGDMKHKLLFCWDISHCTGTGFNTLENRHKPLVCKDLRKIWEKDDPNLPWEKGDYNESNTLLLDDSPYKALLNPMHTAIFPHSYSFKDRNDNSLGPGGDIRMYLEALATAENVQKYVEQHPFGQSGIDETSSFWGFYSKVLHCQSIVSTRR